ncbi:protein phosphatase 2C domain-containing protein [Streptomyces sp. NBC_01537]|uniref:protein phosphatase 2C domain-containing protein n=1 Tax=Streptomyces sp. NBC_01537 TaxID=2903896 RepID=UPI00386869F3
MFAIAPQFGAALSVGDRTLADSADAHPDWCAGYAQDGGYLVIGASAVGRLHLRNKVPRDDAFAARSAGRWLAVAVSDGVGSRRLSRYGSTFCVQALCEELLRDLDGQSTLPAYVAEADPHSPAAVQGGVDDLRAGLSSLSGRRLEDPTIAQLDMRAHHAGTLAWNRRLAPHTPRRADQHPAASENEPDAQGHVIRAFEATRSRLAGFVAERELDLHAVSCTLLGLLIDTESGQAACGQVGDGLISVLDGKRGAHPMLWAPAPDEAGATYVITQNDWRDYLETAVLTGDDATGISSIMIMTDGVSEDYLYPPPEGIFEQWCCDMDARLRETDAPFASLRLLYWLAQYEHPGSFDDRTLVAVLTSEGPNPSSEPGRPAAATPQPRTETEVPEPGGHMPDPES